MSLLPIMTAFEMASPSQAQETVSVASENEVSGSFAETLEALGQLDQQGKPAEETLEPQEAQEAQHETEQVSVDVDKKEWVLDLRGQSEVEQDERQNIEVDVSKKQLDIPVLSLFQAFSGIKVHPETQPLGESLIEEASVPEETEVDLKGNHLPKTEFHIEKGLGGQGGGDLPLNPFSDDLKPTEVLSDKWNESSKTVLPAEPSQLETGQTEALKVEVVKTGQNENGGHTETEKLNTASDEFFVRSPGRAEIFATAQESSPLLDNQEDGEITLTKEIVPEESEIDFERRNVLSQLQKAKPQFEENPARQGLHKDLAATKKMNVSSLHPGEMLSDGESEKDLSINPVSENLRSSEVLTPKNSVSSKIGTFAEQSVEQSNIEAIKIAQNENRQDTNSAKGSKAGDALLVKSPSEAGIEDMAQEYLSSDAQAGESPEAKEGPGGVQDRSAFNDDLLKVSSLAQTLSLEAEAPVADLERPALGLSEKTAILSQVTEQFRALQPGKLEQLRLSLHPESLGALQVEITLQKGAVIAHIITGDHLVKDLLEANQALLRQSLGEQGFEVDGFSVDVGDAEGGFKDRETERPFFENRRFNPESDVSPLSEPMAGFNSIGKGSISLYV